MSNILKKYRKSLTVVSFLGIMAGAYYFGIRILLTSIESKNVKIQETAALREYRQDRLKHLPEFRVQKEAIDRDEAKLKSVIDQSDKESVKVFIESIEKLAERVGVRYETVSLSDKVEKVKPKASNKTSTSATKKSPGIWAELPDVPYLRFELRASGSFQNIYGFLRKIENVPYLLDVVEIKIVPIDKKVAESTGSGGALSSSPIISRNASRILADAASSRRGEEVELWANLVIYTEKKSDE